MAGNAILAIRRDVTGIRCRAVSAFCPLAGVSTIVAGVAAIAADCRMTHGVACEAGRRIGVTIATLHGARRNVRRSRHTSCRRAIVAGRTVGVRGLVNVCPARPTAETRRGAGVTGDTVATACGHVASIRGRALRPLGALACE